MAGWQAPKQRGRQADRQKMEEIYILVNSELKP